MAMIMMIFVIIDMMIFVIIDIIQVAQKQKELQARFKELEKQEQVWTISVCQEKDARCHTWT